MPLAPPATPPITAPKARPLTASPAIALPISDVHSHMEMLNICHLAGISARFGRELKWDDDNEQIVGDSEAYAFLARPYRSGYEIEM